MNRADLAKELEADRGANRDLDARVAVALYEDSGHTDSRDNTHARQPSNSDECAPGTYWISAFSGLSLRIAPDYTSDRTLKRLALVALRTPDGDSLPGAAQWLLAAIAALGQTPPGRKDTYFEAPLLATDDGVARWQELDRAGKAVRTALSASRPVGEEPVTCPRALRLGSPLRYCMDCPEGDECELPNQRGTLPEPPRSHAEDSSE